MSVPDGYRFPDGNDSMRPYVCERCGASIVGSAIDTHDAWHADLARMTADEVMRLLRRKRARA